MAAESRSTSLTTVIHSDHGTQFTSWAFTENIRRFGLMGSMGTIGDCYDNAPMESFWGSMQIELLDRQSWKTVLELSTAMADYIETFYNPTRRHSSLAYLTPNEFEDLHLNNAQTEFDKSGPLSGVKVNKSWSERCVSNVANNPGGAHLHGLVEANKRSQQKANNRLRHCWNALDWLGLDVTASL